MKNWLRLFIAVSLSPSVQAGVEKAVRALKAEGDEINWVDTNNLHVTLKFLGDVHLNDLPPLINCVTQSVVQTDAFDLSFQGFGVFPNRESPKTLWIGCRDGAEELGQLAENINAGLVALGFPKDTRRFSPHLTIGRIKKGDHVLSCSSLLEKQQDRSFGSCSVGEVQIFSSELTRKGPIYDEIAAVPLRF